MQTTWKPTNLIIAIKGGTRSDESLKIMRENDEKRYWNIRHQAEFIIDHAEAIVRNDKGELALLCDGTYYPLQIGKWTIKDFYVLGNFDTGEQETHYFDMNYNACLSLNGINFFLLVVDKDKWEQLNQEL